MQGVSNSPPNLNTQRMEDVPSKKDASALKIKNVSNSVYVLETMTMVLPDGYDFNPINLTNTRKIDEKEISKYLKIKILEEDGEFNYACFPSILSQKIPLKFKFIFSINKDKKMLIFESLFGDKDAPFNASDVFEFMYKHALECTDIEDDLHFVKIEGISMGENKNLATNLEKIRTEELEEQEKILKMENELFTGEHSGKSTIRSLDRIKYYPVTGTLQIDLSKPILPGDDLIFNVIRQPKSK